jgi:DNA-directed RNA polymerase-3 subunit RPC5
MPNSPQKPDKRLADAKEVHVSTRKAEDRGNVPYPQGGLTAVRREMLLTMRTEEEEKWEDLDFYDTEVCFSCI